MTQQNHKTVIWNFDFLPNPPDGYLLSYQASTGLWIPVITPPGITRKIGATIFTANSPYAVQATDDFLPVNSSGGAVIVNLPAVPTLGKVYTIADGYGSAGTLADNITVNGNGIQIAGSSSYVINTNFGQITVTYNGLNWTKQ